MKNEKYWVGGWGGKPGEHEHDLASFIMNNNNNNITNHNYY